MKPRQPSVSKPSRDKERGTAGKSPRRERSESSKRGERSERPSPFAAQTFMVDGLAAVSEYARFSPQRIQEIYCAPKAKQSVLDILAKYELRVPVREQERGEGTEHLAPVAARVELKALPFDAFLSRLATRSRDVVVALDHITDPRNLGAVVRSAAFFGVKEVLVPERRQVLLTQAAVNTAQGGFALTDLVVVVNLSRALTALKDKGYWSIGTAMNGELFTKVAGVYERSVLVLGSEDHGLSRQVADTCDRLAAIPGQGGGLDSLNVSVAAGIFLCEFTRSPLTTA